MAKKKRKGDEGPPYLKPLVGKKGCVSAPLTKIEKMVEVMSDIIH